ncbi:MAG TPA: hypothetical protein VM121_03360 [Acidimicrobiales bacterium]|nr:hypothetical protein [Acidimicrobiales bacterium]
MSAPDYVPVILSDKARTSLPLPPSRRWTATRPADLDRGQPSGPMLGSQGPDQGYALRLAQFFVDRLQLVEGEKKGDVMAGCVPIAGRRASLFGRAPVIHDLELAFGMWGYLNDAPSDLIAYRKSFFFGAGHDYWRQREIATQIPEATLRLTPAQAASTLASWRELLGA